MHRLAAAMCTAFVASAAAAMTWDFDTEGDAQGWTAYEGVDWRASSLDVEVRDGVLSVAPLPFAQSSCPMVRLCSPEIGYDSALFDRIVVRFRLNHSQPVSGTVSLIWANGYMPSPRNAPGRLVERVTYTTDWQEVVFTDLTGYVWQGTSLWRDELIDIRITFEAAQAASAADVPESVEVDWLQLTGVEEQLRGELPPPAVRGASAPTGDLFASAFYCPLDDAALVDGHFDPGVSACLGDLDGDGDADLVATYDVGYPDGYGWLTATNDGSGHFVCAEDHYLGITDRSPMLQGSDLDGDSRMDLVVSGPSTGTYEQLRNDPRAGWVVEEVFQGAQSAALADADGDGVADLWLQEDLGAEEYALWLRLNDGTGHWLEPWRVPSPSAPGTWFWAYFAQHLAGGAVTGALEVALGGGAWAIWLTPDGEELQAFLDTRGSSRNFAYFGDLDHDGDVDTVVGDSTVMRTDRGCSAWHGLSVLRNAGNGSLVSEPLDPDVLIPLSVTVADVNGDGCLDVVYVDSQLRDPAVVVRLGSADGTLTMEGRYPLSGGGGPVLTGDVNCDGRVDLVVLERSAEGQGGVHVLLSRLGEGITAVSHDASADGGPALPYRVTLAPSYPNPFNPEVTIPFTLAADAQRVRLVIYNVLGQPVRTLLDGPLPAGEHRASWDGRDERGSPVPSGAYCHRLQAGRPSGCSVTGRSVRIE